MGCCFGKNKKKDQDGEGGSGSAGQSASDKQPLIDDQTSKKEPGSPNTQKRK